MELEEKSESVMELCSVEKDLAMYVLGFKKGDVNEAVDFILNTPKDRILELMSRKTTGGKKRVKQKTNRKITRIPDDLSLTKFDEYVALIQEETGTTDKIAIYALKLNLYNPKEAIEYINETLREKSDEEEVSVEAVSSDSKLTSSVYPPKPSKNLPIRPRYTSQENATSFDPLNNDQEEQEIIEIDIQDNISTISKNIFEDGEKTSFSSLDEEEKNALNELSQHYPVDHVKFAFQECFGDIEKTTELLESTTFSEVEKLINKDILNTANLPITRNIGISPKTSNSMNYNYKTASFRRRRKPSRPLPNPANYSTTNPASRRGSSPFNILRSNSPIKKLFDNSKMHIPFDMGIEMNKEENNTSLSESMDSFNDGIIPLNVMNSINKSIHSEQANRQHDSSITLNSRQKRVDQIRRKKLQQQQQKLETDSVMLKSQNLKNQSLEENIVFKNKKIEFEKLKDWNFNPSLPIPTYVKYQRYLEKIENYRISILEKKKEELNNQETLDNNNNDITSKKKYQRSSSNNSSNSIEKSTDHKIENLRIAHPSTTDLEEEESDIILSSDEFQIASDNEINEEKEKNDQSSVNKTVENQEYLNNEIYEKHEEEIENQITNLSVRIFEFLDFDELIIYNIGIFMNLENLLNLSCCCSRLRFLIISSNLVWTKLIFPKLKDRVLFEKYLVKKISKTKKNLNITNISFDENEELNNSSRNNSFLLSKISKYSNPVISYFSGPYKTQNISKSPEGIREEVDLKNKKNMSNSRNNESSETLILLSKEDEHKKIEIPYSVSSLFLSEQYKKFIQEKKILKTLRKDFKKLTELDEEKTYRNLYIRLFCCLVFVFCIFLIACSLTITIPLLGDNYIPSSGYWWVLTIFPIFVILVPCCCCLCCCSIRSSNFIPLFSGQLTKQSKFNYPDPVVVSMCYFSWFFWVVIGSILKILFFRNFNVWSYFLVPSYFLIMCSFLGLSNIPCRIFKYLNIKYGVFMATATIVFHGISNILLILGLSLLTMSLDEIIPMYYSLLFLIFYVWILLMFCVVCSNICYIYFHNNFLWKCVTNGSSCIEGCVYWYCSCCALFFCCCVFFVFLQFSVLLGLTIDLQTIYRLTTFVSFAPFYLSWIYLVPIFLISVCGFVFLFSYVAVICSCCWAIFNCLYGIYGLIFQRVD